MLSNRKSLTLALVVLLIAAIAVGASGVLAQDSDTAPGFGWRHDDMMGSGPTMWSAVAEALGMDPEALWTALHSGQTLEAIAEAQGVELDAIYEAAAATMSEHLAAMVEAGVVTQEQADEHLAWMQGNLGQMPMMMGEGCGMAMGRGMQMGMANAGCPLMGEDAMMPGMGQGMMNGMGHMGGMMRGGMMGGSNMDQHRGHHGW